MNYDRSLVDKDLDQKYGVDHEKLSESIVSLKNALSERGQILPPIREFSATVEAIQDSLEDYAKQLHSIIQERGREDELIEINLNNARQFTKECGQQIREMKSYLLTIRQTQVSLNTIQSASSIVAHTFQRLTRNRDRLFHRAIYWRKFGIAYLDVFLPILICAVSLIAAVYKAFW